MKIARYSLLTLRPDPERLDIVCIGAVIRTDDAQWRVLTPETGKLASLGAHATQQRLPRMAGNLEELLQDADTLNDARTRLRSLRGTLDIHEFEGVFAYANDDELGQQVHAIACESILPATKLRNTIPLVSPPKPRIRARLRRDFLHMGILAPKGAPHQPRMVFPNFPISLKHDLRAEFAIRNRNMIVTETLDFDVVADLRRAKAYEAQAKCLVMRIAQETFGDQTQRLIVINGAWAQNASHSVDLLATAGELFAVESSDDMHRYFDIIASAAGSTRPITPALQSCA